MNDVGKEFLSGCESKFRRLKVDLEGETLPEIFVHELPSPELHRILDARKDDKNKLEKHEVEAHLVINGAFDDGGNRIWADDDLASVFKGVPGRIQRKIAHAFLEVNALTKESASDLAKNSEATTDDDAGSD